jgi:hypothetical protein
MIAQSTPFSRRIAEGGRSMRQICRSLLLVSAAAGLFAILANGQDGPSMADVARQARQQKQSKEAQANGAPASKTPKVITNEEIPEHPETADDSVSPEGEGRGEAASPAASDGARQSAEQWKAQIRAQKDLVNSMQSSIQKVSDSIQFAPGNCVAGCVQWNEHHKQKQQEVERARSQLESQKKRLESMQESARRQGYGSAVYDP